ncbi:Type 1 glutamine amidotransferase-like domain-containing protein [Aggregatilinea lenta]|uniref:Type 1 glutamine amidotransferase-like domain-containing protein n=1 Tax=Aggregatilinea lenta TaxID=913108 RepID=UPI000E5C308D|nr:Type 1 glutamine amidotransferase-like domain-containing protein [Aggregatilinea lenta]
MPQVNIFRWREGGGWLVVSGGGAVLSEDVQSIEARVLVLTHSQGPIAYIWAAGDIDAADAHMDSLQELGARTGYLVDILTEEDDVLFRQLNEAGVIILGGGPRVDVLADALSGVVLRAIEDAFARGATVYAVGESAGMLAAYSVRDDTILPGIGWLAGALALPGYSADQADRLRDLVYAHPEAYGLGLAVGAAMAFGPQGEVEVWGNRQVTVSLGTPGSSV